MNTTRTRRCTPVGGYCPEHCTGPACHTRLFYPCCGACQEAGR